MRLRFESDENQYLAFYSCKSSHSKGRFFDEPPCDLRTCFQRDRDRIVHSKAFRRLKHKTQVFLSLHSDHVRSRLTHTIEVAQISRHLARLLLCNEDLSECIALAHDLGHTPFGHSGEIVLNECMENHGGFEHNKQSQRIVSQLEMRYPEFNGLNLSKEILDGLIKHRTPWDTPEDTHSFPTLEAEIVNLADEIAYNNHDIDDGLSSNLITLSQLESEVDLWRETKNQAKKDYVNLSNHELKNIINRRLISKQIRDAFHCSKQNIDVYEQQNVEPEHYSQAIGFSSEMKALNTQLRQFLYDNFYSHPYVKKSNEKGQEVIRHLFAIYSKDISLIPEDYRLLHKDTQIDKRLICDYISGMTDNFAMTEYFSISGY